MPQFDTFSFFSQLFWVFFGFNYLYLSFCFYILPVLSIVLKVRAKKIAEINNNASNIDLVKTSESKNSLISNSYFSSLAANFSQILDFCLVKNQTAFFSKNSLYIDLQLKNAAFRNFRFLLLKRLNVFALFLTKK